MSGSKAANARDLVARRHAGAVELRAYETDTARRAAFKRAMQLCDWAAREFIRAGRDDAARAAWKAIDAAL